MRSVLQFYDRQVVQAHFAKFPDPAHVPEIKRVDVVGRVDVRDSAAAPNDALPTQFSSRKFTVENTAPRVIKAFGLPDPVFFLEESAVDPNARVMRTRSKNLSFGWLGECTEETEFRATREGRTSVVQYGACECHHCGPVKGVVEKYANRFVTGGAKDGVAAFRSYLARSAAAIAETKKKQAAGALDDDDDGG